MKKKIKARFDPAEAVGRSKRLMRKSGLLPAKDEVADKNILPETEAIEVLLRPFQKPVFRDERSGILVLHWARQIGKSYVLAAWAVHRLFQRPGRLVTVLSNSRENGAEFLEKCAEICRLIDRACKTVDESGGLGLESMRMELRLRVKRKVGRIKILAANARTARGFSGDLILDEFAFHEDSAGIWEAAEPILASNADFLCRIASTGNGRHNLFYRMVQGRLREGELMVEGKRDGEIPSSNVQAAGKIQDSSFKEGEVEECGAHGRCFRPGNAPCLGDSGHQPSTLTLSTSLYTSAAGFRVSRVSRSEAHELGVKIFDALSRKELTPEQARRKALDKRAYDQNYECSFADESLTLLSHELVSAAEGEDVGEICEQDWSQAGLERMRIANGQLYAGFDVARKHDLSVITVVERLSGIFFVRGILRMRGLRLPEQQVRLGEVCRMAQFQRAAIDMTGMGLGLFEQAQKEFGSSRIQGVNFGSAVPATRAVQNEGARRDSVRVTEAMAMELLQAYEGRRLRQPEDEQLREDLRKPERVTTPGGRVSIAATRDAAGHADHFWSLALALEAASRARRLPEIETFKAPRWGWMKRRLVI